MSEFSELLEAARSLAGMPEDDGEDWRDRFYDERDEPELPEFYGCCGACDEFYRCDIKGHEEIGWCNADGEFRLVTDPDECD